MPETLVKEILGKETLRIDIISNVLRSWCISGAAAAVFNRKLLVIGAQGTENVLNILSPLEKDAA